MATMQSIREKTKKIQALQEALDQSPNPQIEKEKIQLEHEEADEAFSLLAVGEYTDPNADPIEVVKDEDVLYLMDILVAEVNAFDGSHIEHAESFRVTAMSAVEEDARRKWHRSFVESKE